MATRQNTMRVAIGVQRPNKKRNVLMKPGFILTCLWCLNIAGFEFDGNFGKQPLPCLHQVAKSIIILVYETSYKDHSILRIYILHRSSKKSRLKSSHDTNERKIAFSICSITLTCWYVQQYYTRCTLWRLGMCSVARPGPARLMSSGRAVARNSFGTMKIGIVKISKLFRAFQIVKCIS